LAARETEEDEEVEGSATLKRPRDGDANGVVAERKYKKMKKKKSEMTRSRDRKSATERTEGLRSALEAARALLLASSPPRMPR